MVSCGHDSEQSSQDTETQISAEYKEYIEQQKNQIQELLLQITSLKDQIVTTGQNQENQQQLQAYEQQLALLQEELEQAKKTEEYVELQKSQISELEQKIAELEAQADAEESSNQDEELKLQQYKNQLTNLQRELDQAQRDQQASTLAHQATVDELNRIQEQLNEYMNRNQQEQDVISAVPELDNIAKTVQSVMCADDSTSCSNTSAKICDQTLSSKKLVDEHRKLLMVRNPDSSPEQIEAILAAQITQASNRCAFLQNTGSDTYQISSDATNLILFVEGCPGISRPSRLQFNCYTKTYAINSTPLEIKLNLGDKIMLLSSGTPISAHQNYPYTHIGSTEHFWLEPHTVPANKSLRITQAYLGNYSHQNRYAVDFNIGVNEDISASRTGIVVTNNTGSTINCQRKNLAYGKRYQIFDGVTRVDDKGAACPECEYSSFPSICSGSNSANRILIAHNDNTYSSYMHLLAQNPHAQFGDVVSTGKKVGKIGLSGWCDGAHLHWEVQQAKIDEHDVNFSTIPVYFRPKYNADFIYPDTEGIYLNVPLTDSQILEWKQEWDQKNFTITNLPANSANFGCEQRFGYLKDAPNDCHFTITGSSYWPQGFDEANINYYAKQRAEMGYACLKELLGNSIEATLETSYSPIPQVLPAATQKLYRSISVDISCF